VTEILAVVGSVTPPGRWRGAVEAALGRCIERDGVQGRLIDLAEVRVGFADGRPPEQFADDTGRVVAAMADAEALILASPTYRGSFTGALKNLLDHVPVAALQGKPIGIVAMGATAHHFLGVDRHLRDVLAFYGAHVTPVSVYLTNADFVDGAPIEAARADLDVLFSAVADLVELTKGRRLGGDRPLPRRP
jgi:FMN reductase